MSNLATLARPYSKAAYQYAVSKGMVNEWLKFLTLSGEIVAAPQVAETFKNPRIEIKNVLTLFLGNDALNKALEPFRNFLQLLWENQRLAVLPMIAAQFTALHLQAENVVEAELVAAQAMEENEIDQLKQQLEQKWNAKLKLQVRVDESLLGGALIRIGDRVIDGSVKTQIEQLTRALERV